MVYPHKWSPISYRSSAGQRKHAGQRPMFYRWTTQPTRGAHESCCPSACPGSRRHWVYRTYHPPATLWTLTIDASLNTKIFTREIIYVTATCTCTELHCTLPMIIKIKRPLNQRQADAAWELYTGWRSWYHQANGTNPENGPEGCVTETTNSQPVFAD